MTISVSELGLSQALSGSLTTYQTQLTQLQETLASGQNIQTPSSDPTGVVNLLAANASLGSYQQYQSNIKSGQTVASLANSALTQAGSIMQQIRSVLVQAGAPGVTASVASGLAAQVQGLETSLVGVANTTYVGTAIFGGTKAVSQAYGPSGNFLGGGIAPSTVVAPGLSVPTTIVNPFGSTASATSPGGVFGAINQAVLDLQSGNTSAATGSDLAAVSTQLNNLTNQAAQAGTNYQQFQTMSTQITSAITQITGEVSGLQTIDYAKLTTQYQQQLNNYKVALFAASQVNQPSLAQYL
ncbi:MAG: flagellin N-terminal helical domain-containing protein [Ferrimicrobium sp.]